jgi:membrane protein implicated in regulation of membrane protease activity
LLLVLTWFSKAIINASFVLLLLLSLPLPLLPLLLLFSSFVSPSIYRLMSGKERRGRKRERKREGERERECER